MACAITGRIPSFATWYLDGLHARANAGNRSHRHGSHLDKAAIARLIGRRSDSTYCRRGPVQRGGDRTHRPPSDHATGDLFPFGQAQHACRASSLRRTDATRLRQDPSNRGMWPIKQCCNLVQGLAPVPAIPHQALLAVGVVNPRPVRHPQYPCCSWQSSVCCIDQLNPRSEGDFAVPCFERSL